MVVLRLILIRFLVLYRGYRRRLIIPLRRYISSLRWCIRCRLRDHLRLNRLGRLHTQILIPAAEHAEWQNHAQEDG